MIGQEGQLELIDCLKNKIAISADLEAALRTGLQTLSPFKRVRKTPRNLPDFQSY